MLLDNCCYNRPFDDQTQERIHLESEAILTILRRGQSGEYEIIGSDILELEMDRMHDKKKKQWVKELYKVLKDALGPVGMVRFMQQYDLGYGDYTQERQDEHDIELDEVEKLLRNK